MPVPILLLAESRGQEVSFLLVQIVKEEEEVEEKLPTLDQYHLHPRLYEKVQGGNINP